MFGLSRYRDLCLPNATARAFANFLRIRGVVRC